MTTIIGIAGSLRAGSYNAALLRAAADLAPDTCRIAIESIRGIPLYDADVEAQGTPAPVARLKDLVAAAAGLLLVTPEYNNSIPGVFKNAIDWLSSPPSDLPRVFADRPVALIGASPGRLGTAFSQTAWLQVFRALGVRVHFGSPLYVGGAAKLFDAEGKLTDADTRRRLQAFVAGFAEFCAR
jgi:NAD(P)H-dependent FMN reductase